MAFYSDFSGHYETVFPLRPKTLQFLQKWLPPSGRILDVGCGTGGYCAELNATGRDCLGIDLDPGMITESERLFPSGRYQILGMQEIGLLGSGTFEGIMCIGNVLPHLSAGRLSAFMMDVHGLLAPGGIWIFQTVNFDPIIGQDDYVFPELNFAEKRLTFLRWYEDIRKDRLQFHTSLITPAGEVFGGHVELYPRTSSDYLLGHRKAGFSLLGHFANFLEHDFEPSKNSGSVFVFRRER